VPAIAGEPVTEDFEIAGVDSRNEVRRRHIPGSNGDHDGTTPSSRNSASRPRTCGTRITTWPGSDVIILPGGFSYGDYLRAGAIARFSPIMTK